MNEEDRRLGNNRKTLLVEDCMNIGPKEYSILSVANGYRPRVLLVCVSEHAIIPEPALFASRHQVCMFRTLNIVHYAAGDIPGQCSFC